MNPIQDKNLFSMEGDDLLAQVTRFSPTPPDLETLLWALAALAAGSVLILFRVRRRKERFGLKNFIPALMIGSLLWCGVFTGRVLIPHLLEPPLSSSRESFTNSGFDAHLEEVAGRVPEHAGIVLINCTSPRQVEWTQYILYPRRIFVEPYSTTRVQDPASLLNPDNAVILAGKGIDWIMDLAPGTIQKGIEASLFPVPVEEEK